MNELRQTVLLKYLYLDILLSFQNYVLLFLIIHFISFLSTTFSGTHVRTVRTVRTGSYPPGFRNTFSTKFG